MRRDLSVLRDLLGPTRRDVGSPGAGSPLPGTDARPAWARLQHAVSELVNVHDVRLEEIYARVTHAAAGRADDAAADAPEG